MIRNNILKLKRYVGNNKLKKAIDICLIHLAKEKELNKKIIHLLILERNELQALYAKKELGIITYDDFSFEEEELNEKFIEWLDQNQSKLNGINLRKIEIELRERNKNNVINQTTKKVVGKLKSNNLTIISLLTIILIIIIIFFYIWYDTSQITSGEIFIREPSTTYQKDNGVKIYNEKIKILSDVYALDIFETTNEDNKKIQAYPNATNFKGYSFNTFKKLEKNYKKKLGGDINQNPSFSRIDKIINSLDTTQDFFSFKSRKKVIFDSAFWNPTEYDLTPIVPFTKKPQPSITVLSISCRDIKSVVLSLKDDEGVKFRLHTTIANNQSTESLSIPHDTKNTFHVCCFEGEEIHIKMMNGDKIKIEVKDIINPGGWRTGSDIVIVEWEIE